MKLDSRRLVKFLTGPVRWWHETDQQMQSPHVRCWGINGPGWNAARSLKMTHSRTRGSFSELVKNAASVYSGTRKF
jgi:hypothetical protein